MVTAALSRGCTVFSLNFHASTAATPQPVAASKPRMTAMMLAVGTQPSSLLLTTALSFMFGLDVVDDVDVLDGVVVLVVRVACVADVVEVQFIVFRQS